MWGVVVDVELSDAPVHVLEEAGIDALTSEDVPDVLFSAVTARGISAIGSTFMPDKPDPETLAPEILANARRFLVDLGSVRGLRACARPGSADGRPMLGRIEAELYVASGHGAWGITLGPASARLVADLALGRPVDIPPALDVQSVPYPDVVVDVSVVILPLPVVPVVVVSVAVVSVVDGVCSVDVSVFGRRPIT